jgi:xylulokinase
MGGKLVAGIDCSTQSTKVVVVEVDTGRIIAEGRGEHEVVFAEGNRAETDPHVWWHALVQAFEATGMADRVDAVAVGGQQHGLVIVDEAGEPLRPAMLWCDLRSAPQAEALVERLGGAQAAASLTGSLPIASFTAPKWAWVREHEPDVADRAAGVRLPHDWLTEQLTDRAVTDRGDASGTAWWSPAEGRYLPEVLAHPDIALDPAMLPDVLAPDQIAGEVTAQAAAALGLRPGIPVGPGTGDNAAAALGLGIAPGEPVISLGTSGTAYLRADRPSADPSGAIAGFADATGAHLPLVCVQNCTLAIDAMTRLLGLDRDDVADRTGVVVLPYLEGERTPYLPHATGSVVGLRPDTPPQELLLATYQGVAATLLAGMDLLPDIDPTAPLTLIGGGARGRTWQRIVRELSGRPVSIPEQTELVAIGAAVQAAGIVTDQPFATVSAAWDTRRGIQLPALARQDQVLRRIQHVDAALRSLHAVPLPG